MRRYILIVLLTILWTSSNAQIIFKSGEDTTFPDLRIRVGNNVTFADIRARIGEDVTFADFTVRLTNKINRADFIVTDKNNYDLRIRAGEDVTFADLKIKVGSDVTFEDVRIKLKSSGIADYLVYINKDKSTINDIVIALLPAINKHLDYKYESIPRIK